LPVGWAHMPDVAMPAVIGLSAAIMGATWLLFRRVTLTRPPIGVIGLGDVAFVVVIVVFLPFLYLAVPPFVAALILLIVMTSILAVICGAVLPGRLGLAVAIALAAADVAVSMTAGGSDLALVVNDVVVGLAIVGVANLWAQAGMRAAHLAVLAAGLTVYDIVATSVMTQTGELMERLAGLPFAAIIAWPSGAPGEWLGIGVGDLLVASTFAIVFRKAYGRTAGLVAAASAIGCIALLLVLANMRVFSGTFPVMVILGPVVIVEFLLWRSRRGPERTMQRYLTEEPLRGVRVVAPVIFDPLSAPR